MKSNEITEGIWDDMKSGYKAGKQDYIRKQAEKMGMTAAPAAPSEPENPIKVQHDHIDQMFKSGKLSKPAYDIAKAELPPLPPAAPEPIDPAAATKQGAANQYGAMTAQATPKATPATPKPAPPMSMGGKASASFGGVKSYSPAASTAPATAPTTPKAGDPVPGMSGYVYTGKMGANGKPQAIKSAPAVPAADPATAPSTLPTKAKSKAKPKDIDIDAALKMADSLSPDEKKKLLQDLLKSGVKVSAGGA